MGGYLLISSKDQRWYAPFFAMVIAILPHIISIKMINEKKNQIICRIIQQVVAYAVIITLSLICDFSIFNMQFACICFRNIVRAYIFIGDIAFCELGFYILFFAFFVYGAVSAFCNVFCMLQKRPEIKRSLHGE